VPNQRQRAYSKQSASRQSAGRSRPHADSRSTGGSGSRSPIRGGRRSVDGRVTSLSDPNSMPYRRAGERAGNDIRASCRFVRSAVGLATAASARRLGATESKKQPETTGRVPGGAARPRRRARPSCSAGDLLASDIAVSAQSDAVPAHMVATCSASRTPAMSLPSTSALGTDVRYGVPTSRRGAPKGALIEVGPKSHDIRCDGAGNPSPRGQSAAPACHQRRAAAGRQAAPSRPLPMRRVNEERSQDRIGRSGFRGLRANAGAAGRLAPRCWRAFHKCECLAPHPNTFSGQTNPGGVSSRGSPPPSRFLIG
jgi:hypothetical protein